MFKRIREKRKLMDLILNIWKNPSVFAKYQAEENAKQAHIKRMESIKEKYCYLTERNKTLTSSLSLDEQKELDYLKYLIKYHKLKI
jgi:hypothetical protein